MRPSLWLTLFTTLIACTTPTHTEKQAVDTPQPALQPTPLQEQLGVHLDGIVDVPLAVSGEPLDEVSRVVTLTPTETLIDGERIPVADESSDVQAALSRNTTASETLLIVADANVPFSRVQDVLLASQNAGTGSSAQLLVGRADGLIWSGTTETVLAYAGEGLALRIHNTKVDTTAAPLLWVSSRGAHFFRPDDSEHSEPCCRAAGVDRGRYEWARLHARALALRESTTTSTTLRLSIASSAEMNVATYVHLQDVLAYQRGGAVIEDAELYRADAGEPLFPDVVFVQRSLGATGLLSASERERIANPNPEPLRDGSTTTQRRYTPPPYKPTELDATNLEERIAKGDEEIHACYALGTLGDAELAGEVTVRWFINEHGGVQDASVVQSSLDNAEVDTCILETVEAWFFYPHTRRTPVEVKRTYTFPSEG